VIGKQRSQKWPVYVYRDGAKRYVGSFPTREEAQRVETLAKRGEYVRVESVTVARWALESKGELTCRVCADPAEHLHHLIPAAIAGQQQDPLTAGIPLCDGCHKGWHHRATAIFRDCLLPEEVAYIIGTMGVAWLDLHYPPAPTSADVINGILLEEVRRLRLENRELHAELDRRAA
jgi:hypothetical protein